MKVCPILVHREEVTPDMLPLGAWDDDLAAAALIGAYKVLRRELRARSVRALHLSYRAVNVLVRHGILTVGDLLERTWEDLARLDGVGPVVLRDIEAGLALAGLSLDGSRRAHV